MNLSEFTKCDVLSRGQNRGDCVYVNKKSHTVTISASLVEKAGLTKGDRVDLYRKDATFALKKAKAGCVTLGISSKNSNSLIARGTGLCLQITPFTHGKTAFPGWVEDDVIFFTAEDNDMEV